MFNQVTYVVLSYHLFMYALYGIIIVSSTSGITLFPFESKPQCGAFFLYKQVA